MVVQKIKDINIKNLKYAQGVMEVLELLGITEDDLLLLKEIPAMKAELEELRDFKERVIRTIDTKNASKDVKPASKVVSDVYGTPTKEFNPHYEG